MTNTVNNNNQSPKYTQPSDVSIRSTTPFVGDGESIAPTLNTNNNKDFSTLYTHYKHNHENLGEDVDIEVRPVSSPSYSSSTSPIESNRVSPSAPPAYFDDNNDNIGSSDVIASQDHALTFIQQQQQQQQNSIEEQDNKNKIPNTSSTGSNGSNEAKNRLHVPRSINPSGSDAINPHKNINKVIRRANTSRGVLSGMIWGGLFFGPVGLIVGATTGGVVANRLSKASEKRAQRKYEQVNFQSYATKSSASRAVLV